MSKKLSLFKGKGNSGASRLAATVYPGDSASQVTSNMLTEEDHEAGGDSKARLALAQIKAEQERGSAVSATSKAVVPANQNFVRSDSTVPRQSRVPNANMFQIEDVSSSLGSARGGQSKTTRKSRAMVPSQNPATQQLAGSTVSGASTGVSKNSSRIRNRPLVVAGGQFQELVSAVSRASQQLTAAGTLVTQGTPSSISKAGSRRSAVSSRSLARNLGNTIVSVSNAMDEEIMVSTVSASKAPPLDTTAAFELRGDASSVSKVSSVKGDRVSSLSRSSRRSKALVPTGKVIRKSPLANEVRTEDLKDDMYSISIHERGATGQVPSLDELLQIILRLNPAMDLDEASSIADNQIATGSQKARSQVGDSTAAPSSAIARSSTSKTLSAWDKQMGQNVPEPSVISRAESSRSKAQSAFLPQQSTISKVSSVNLLPMVQAASPSPTTNVFVFPKSGISPLLASASSSLIKSETSQETSVSDLLALANLRSQRELQRAQAVANFEAMRANRGGDLERNRMTELELSKQTLEDSRTLTRLQELSIHDDKLATLARHAHEDQLAALERANISEADRRTAIQVSALRDKEQQERSRNRTRRGDITKAEHRREELHDQETQKEYERMDHDHTMDKIDAFDRLAENARPRNAPQPSRSRLQMEQQWGYHNPRTGGSGDVSMRIGKGCARSGDGTCVLCGQDYSEHPMRLKSDGTIVGKSSKVFGKGAPPFGSDASSLSKARSRKR